MRKNFYKVSDRSLHRIANVACNVLIRKKDKERGSRLFRKPTDYLESQIIHKNYDTHITLNIII